METTLKNQRLSRHRQKTPQIAKVETWGYHWTLRWKPTPSVATPPENQFQRGWGEGNQCTRRWKTDAARHDANDAIFSADENWDATGHSVGKPMPNARLDA